MIKPTFSRLWLALTCFTTIAACGHKRVAVSGPELTTPALAAASLDQPGSLYFNAAARNALLAARPDLTAEADRDPQSPRSRAFAQAVQDPQLFRKLDRESRFDTLWLVGDPSHFKPLLEHLLTTKDFAVAYLDHTSLILKRGSESSWKLEELDRLAGRWKAPCDQAYVRASAALRLLALRENDQAKGQLEHAESLCPDVAEVWSGWSTYWMIRGDWDRALTAANRALAMDSSFVPAIACKTQILYATKKFREAFDLSETLLETSPDDPGLLFYHAKIAHEAHAYEAEIKTLQRLVSLAEQAGASVSGYRIYMGQAYAAAGDGKNAVDQLTEALLDTNLPREQRAFADELFIQIKDRVGLQ
ncbi:MAG: hypothetical protein ABI680_10040 [Chthoniobacteraceae bacterium]